MQVSGFRDRGLLGLTALAFAAGCLIGCDGSRQDGSQVQMSDEAKAQIQSRKAMYDARAKEKAAARASSKKKR